MKSLNSIRKVQKTGILGLFNVKYPKVFIIVPFSHQYQKFPKGIHLKNDSKYSSRCDSSKSSVNDEIDKVQNLT